jgi:uncharacterized protein (DUF1810 family)
MTDSNDLQRFIDAQVRDFPIALSEIKSARKRSHWMWYIFPQIKGLGFSETARFYALKDPREATDYLKHPVLGDRLIRISAELLKLESTDARAVLGSPDDLKLRSSMTLFSLLPGTDDVFDAVLRKFFGGIKDEKTVQIMGE